MDSLEALQRVASVLDELAKEADGRRMAGTASEAEPATANDGERAGIAAFIYGQRRRRDRLAGADADLFGDPAWDVLLDLYVQRYRRSSVSVSSACIAASVPATTALRWINLLEARGLVSRYSDPFDKRRRYLALTERAVGLVERLLPRTLTAPGQPCESNQAIAERGQGENAVRRHAY